MSDDKPTLTVCMIARNEEATIALALDSLYMERDNADPTLPRNAEGLVPIWDELIVTIAGESTDKTDYIASLHGAKIAYYPAPDGKWAVDANGKELRHYGDARDACEQLATGEYVLWIDADERLVEGHKLIRKIAETQRIYAVRPKIRMLTSNVLTTRQELLHKRGKYRWKGAIHERLEGMPAPVESRILYEEIARPDGDRPHGDMFELLRRDMGDQLQTRQLFYIAREHWNEKQWAQAIACGRLFLDAGGGWVEQRSYLAMLVGLSWMQLDDLYQARAAFIESIKHYGAWAEPYYYLAILHRDIGLMYEAIAWANASLVWAMPDPEKLEMEDTFNREMIVPEIYEWRRFDVLAFCLGQVGRFKEAAMYYRMVMEAHPNDATRKNLSICERKAEEAAA